MFQFGKNNETASRSAPAAWWRITGFGLVISALAAPLAFGAVVNWAWSALGVLALVLLVVWAVACARDQAAAIYWTPLYVPLALFAALAVFQLFARLSLDSFGTREALLNLIAPLLFFFLVGQWVARHGGEYLPRFAITVIVYAFLVSLFAIIQLFSSRGLIYWSVRPRWGGSVLGPYVNHNDYAGLMEILIPIGASYVLSRPQADARKFLFGFAVLLPLTSLLLSGSRGGLVSFLAETVLLMCMMFGGAPRIRRKGLVPIGAGALAVVLLFLWLAPERLISRLETTTRVVRTPEISLGDRLKVSRDALRIFRGHPVLGTGLGTFQEVFPQYQGFASDLRWEHAHNDFAEALAETGLAGGALILLALGLGLRAAFRALHSPWASGAGWIQAGAAIGCCGLLIHSTVDFNLHIPANALWFAISAAIATTPLSFHGMSPK